MLEQKLVPWNVRMPATMRDSIRERAAENRRSMNAEIVHYLDRALAAQNEKGPAATASREGASRADIA